MNDLKLAFRQLWKHKGSSLLAILILALGIGGTTAVFSVADKAVRRFGGDPQVVGQSIKLDGQTYSVIGIMPANVQFPFGGGRSQFWIPHTFTIDELESAWAVQNREWTTLARLGERVRLSELRSLLDVVAVRRASSLNEPDRRWIIDAQPARQAMSGGGLGQTVWSLMAMMGGILRVFYDASEFMNQSSYDLEAALARGVPRTEAYGELHRVRLDRWSAFQRQALERLHAVPGVEMAAVNVGAGYENYEIDGQPGPVELGSASVNVVGGDSLRTLGARLIMGRFLDPADAQPGEWRPAGHQRTGARVDRRLHGSAVHSRPVL